MSVTDICNHLADHPPGRDRPWVGARWRTLVRLVTPGACFVLAGVWMIFRPLPDERELRTRFGIGRLPLRGLRHWIFRRIAFAGYYAGHPSGVEDSVRNLKGHTRDPSTVAQDEPETRAAIRGI